MNESLLGFMNYEYLRNVKVVMRIDKEAVVLQELSSGVTFQIRPRLTGLGEPRDKTTWLPQTLQQKLTKAELLFLEQHRTTIERQTRQQVAHELHGNTLQALTALSYRIATLQLHSTMRQQDLHTLQQDVKTAVAKLRSDISSLRSSSEESSSIKTSLGHYITNLEKHLPLPKIHQTFDSSTEALPQAVCHCVISIFKEGLYNSVTHARAKEVWLTLVHHRHWVIVRVIDNGRGFTLSKLQAKVQKRHYGLVGLAEMVAPFHGQVFVCSKQGKGTALASIIPLEEACHD
jgi:signal transduction histidine kinase